MNFTRQRPVTCCAMLAAFAIALSPTPSLAFITICEFIGTTTLTPAHPQAKDVVTFDILLGPSRPSPAYVVLAKTTFEAGNQIALDVVVAPPDAVPMLPGYQFYPVLAGEIIEGTLGPLAVGQYTVATQIRVYDPATGNFILANCFGGEITRSLTIYSDDGLSPVIEYYDSKLDHYFITQLDAEIAALDAGVFPAGWVRTGQSFLAYRPGQGAAQDVARFYGMPSAGLDTHFFTLSGPEMMGVLFKRSTWDLETFDAFDLDFPSVVVDGVTVVGRCPPGEVPVYRLWNQRIDSNHRYTTDPAIKAQMIAKGYVAEGYGPDAIMMCAFTRQ